MFLNQKTNLPSLDTTSVSIQKPPSTYREYISTEYMLDEFTAVEELYIELNKEYQLDRLRSCRTEAYFVREVETNLVKVLSKSCHVKFCPYCSKSRSRYIQKNTARWLKKCLHPKFVTLTLRHTNEPLRDQLDALYFHFKQLRRLKLWKSKITGGIWFFEIKLSNSVQWHPHIHLVVDGFYISQRKLSKAWDKVTFGSPIIDIRSVKDPKKVSDYVSKYATKPCTLKNLDLKNRITLYEGLKSRRSVGTFGTAHKAKLTGKPMFEHSDYVNIGSWSTVLHLRNDDENAEKIWFAYSTRTPIDPGYSCKMIDEFIVGIPPPDETHFKTLIEEKVLW